MGQQTFIINGNEPLLVSLSGTSPSGQISSESTLSTLNAKFSALGQKTKAQSQPVVIASDLVRVWLTGDQ